MASSVSVPPQHDRDAVRAVALELRLEVAGGQRGAPAELDEVDGVAGDLDHPVDLGDRQPAVEHVRDALLARLGAPVRGGRGSPAIVRGGDATAFGRRPRSRRPRRRGRRWPGCWRRAASRFALEVLRCRATSSAAACWPGAYWTVVSARCWSAALVTWPRAKPPPLELVGRPGRRGPATVVPLSTATVTSARLTGADRRCRAGAAGTALGDAVLGLLAGVPPSSPPPKTWVTRRTTSTTPATAPRTIADDPARVASSVSPSRRPPPPRR